MIHLETATIGKHALDFIKESKHRFYPTGSRYFGTHNEESDYDYFAKRNEVIETDLYANGFLLESHSYSGDPVIVSVFGKNNVHVQLVDDPEMKWYVQLQLAKIFPLMKPTKDQAKVLWRISIQLYRAGAIRKQ